MPEYGFKVGSLGFPLDKLTTTVPSHLQIYDNRELEPRETTSAVNLCSLGCVTCSKNESRDYNGKSELS